MSEHKAGFVSIIGKPNVGKSTLMNALVGEKLSIITPKAQTTRHRIFGIASSEDYQLVFSDTPGVLDPAYKLQQNMMNYVKAALEDADVVLYMVRLEDKHEPTAFDDEINKLTVPVLFVINKIDTAKGSQVLDKKNYWKSIYPNFEYHEISALEHTGIDALKNRILELTPVHPAYFPNDSLTDKTERFIAAEIIREKIFLNYEQEIPYSTEVLIESFKEEADIIRISAVIFVERDSQKGIIIGKKGESIKKTGMQARLDMESFFGKKVFLESFVKVEKDWRKQDKSLKKFGYIQS